MRKVLMVGGALLLVVGLLAGCSSEGPNDDDGSTSTTVEGRPEGDASDGQDGDGASNDGEDVDARPSPGEEAALDVWAEDFCVGFNAWRTSLTAATAEIDLSIDPTDYRAQQDALIAFFDLQADAADEQAGRVATGSVPAIPNGEGLVEELADIYRELAALARAASAEMAALDPSAASFERDGQQVAESYTEDFGAVGQRFGELETTYPALEAEEALNERCSG
jgi:hypothetical protein